MSSSEAIEFDLPPTTVEAIAALEDDIRHRGLRPGDRYLTAAEAAKTFSVSAVTANRAMQVLARRELLVRQRSRGTFIGPKVEVDEVVKPALDVVHVMMSLDYHQSQGVSTDVLADGILRLLPGVVVDVQFIPEANALAYVERVVRRMGQGDNTEGIVLIRGSRQVQLRVQDSGVPGVIYGQVYPGIELSCLKHDQHAVGHLMAEYAVRGGYRRCVLLTRGEWRLGDNKMLDAISQTLAAAGIPLDGLTIRSVPPEQGLVVEAVQTTLEETGEPIAFLCRNEFFAEAAIEVGEGMGRQLGIDFDVVSGGHSPPDGPARYGQIHSVLPLGEQVGKLIELLRSAAEDGNAAPQTVTAPVQFQEPERTLGASRASRNGE